MTTPPTPIAPQDFPAAPLDSYAERITTGVALLGGVLTLPALFWYVSRISAPFQTVIVPLAMALALVVWLMLTYAVQPVSYRVEANRLLIRRRWARPMRVPLTDVVGVSTATALADVPRRGLRRSYNAGVFGYHGPFELDDYGRVFFVATNRERLVAVARFGNLPPLIISPQRPASFVDGVREALQRRVDAPEREDS